MVFKIYVLAFLCFMVCGEKRSLIQGVTELDKTEDYHGILDERRFYDNLYDIEETVILYKLTSGDIFKITDGIDSIGKANKHSFNMYDTMNFAHFMSLLITEYNSPYDDSDAPSLKEFSYDSEYLLDHEYGYQKLNYLALSTFWKDYICIYHSDNKQMQQLHDMYETVLYYFYHHKNDTNASKHLKHFEWVKNGCKPSVEKVAMFLNIASMASKYQSKTRKFVKYPEEVTDSTPVDLDPTIYRGNVTELVHRYRRRNETKTGFNKLNGM